MRCILLLAMAALACAAPAAAQPAGVALRDLGTLGGHYSDATDVNDLGEVVGFSLTASGEDHAFLWTAADGMRDLGTLGGRYSVATAINDFGVVVGYSTGTGDNDAYRAFAWTETGGMIDLGPGQAFDVNNRGEMVGTDAHGALLWRGPGDTIRLTNIPGANSVAFAVNDFSVVAVAALNAIDLVQVSGRSPTVLATIPAAAPTDINNRDVVTGYLHVSAPRAFIWNVEGGVLPLTPLDGRFYSTGHGLNDLGHVVGWSDFADPGIRAVLWRATTTPTPLGTLGGLSWNQSAAYSVNNRGTIVGGSNTASGGWHAAMWEVELTPEERIESLAALLRKVYAAGALNRGLYRSLQNLLTRGNLKVFVKRLDTLDRRGAIPKALADAIRGALDDAAGSLPFRR